MLRGFLTVGGWTMASRVLGLVRDQLLAAFLGAGPAQDAFQLAARLPNMFRRLFGEGAFNAAFVPLFSSVLAREGEAAARSFAREAMGVLGLWLLGLTVLGELFMPQVIWVIGSGLARHPATFALAVSLSRITFPYLMLICLAALVSGVLNGLGRFGAAAAAYVAFNVVGIGCILWLTPYLPSVAYAAAWSFTASGIVQMALLLLAAHRAGMGFGMPRPRFSPGMRTLMRRMVPGLIGSGIGQLNLTVDTVIATWLPPGSLGLMYFADRLNQLPLGVLGSAAGTTMLPLLTRQLQTGQEEASFATQNRAMEYALILTLPAALALVVLSVPLMATLFGHGAFTAHDAVLSAQSLCGYALGLPFFVLVKVLSPGFFARGDTATPVRIGLATLAINLVLNLILMRPLAHVGPPLASSLAAIINTAALLVMLRRRGWLRPTQALLSRLARMLLAALLMTAVLFVVQRLLPHPVARLHGAERIAALAGLIAVGVGTYGLGLLATGVIGLAQLQRWRRRRAANSN
ncbi:murein biosynthesis integral membrane protein MurJ [Lichenicoccus sp.]|uniref:murein biosynthesis integral membrane protein MurJ n=1 Tax=Lichenicoccus sp. TaxID=2781899 RepID=UPI003D09C31E